MLFDSWSLCLKLISQGWWVSIGLLGTWILQSDLLSEVNYSSGIVRFAWTDHVKNRTWHKDAGLPLTGLVWKKAMVRIFQAKLWRKTITRMKNILPTIILCVNVTPPCIRISVLPINYSLRNKVNLLSNLHGSVQPQVTAAVFKEKWINDSVWNKIIQIFMGKSAILYYTILYMIYPNVTNVFWEAAALWCIKICV